MVEVMSKREIEMFIKKYIEENVPLIKKKVGNLESLVRKVVFDKRFLDDLRKTLKLKEEVI